MQGKMIKHLLLEREEVICIIYAVLAQSLVIFVIAFPFFFRFSLVVADRINLDSYIYLLYISFRQM